jgi:heme O synthase-like polyprenyltransferase
MNQSSKWTALLATIRTPNIPSVACNALTGILLASITAPIQTPHAITAIASGILLYLAGNLLNDWHDRDWDALHRPERALPKKIFQPSSYLILAIACSLAGLVTAAANPRSLAIAAMILGLILIYTKSHKSSPLAIIPMGLCRAFLPILGYFACTDQAITPSLILIAAALLIHTCGLSLVARSESTPERHKSRLFLYAYPLAVAIACLAAHINSTRSIIHLWPAALPYLLWTFLALFILRRSAFTGVSMLLAGIPLVDWTFLIPFALGPDASLPWLALCAPPIAFILGKSLQKIVPAT